MEALLNFSLDPSTGSKINNTIGLRAERLLTYHSISQVQVQQFLDGEHKRRLVALEEAKHSKKKLSDYRLAVKQPQSSRSRNGSEEREGVENYFGVDGQGWINAQSLVLAFQPARRWLLTGKGIGVVIPPCESLQRFR